MREQESREIAIKLLDAVAKARKVCDESPNLTIDFEGKVVSIPLCVIDKKSLDELITFVEDYYKLNEVPDAKE